MNTKLLSPLLGGMTLLGAVAIAPSADALTFSYSGDLTGQPTFNRPRQGDPPTLLSLSDNALYQAQAFTVDTTASGYTLIGRWRPASGGPAGGNANADGFLFLYQGSFDPQNPLANLLSGNDDFSDSGICSGSACSRLPNNGLNTLTLTAGVTYIAVASSFDNAGDPAVPTLYTVDINTPGNATVTFPAAATVPEPSTILGLLAVGLLGAGSTLKRKG